MNLLVKDLKIFVNAVERAVPDSKTIYFSCYGGYLILFSKGLEGAVAWYIEHNGEFYGGFDSDRFVNFIKKLKNIENLSLAFKKNKILVKGKGISVSLPITKGFETFQSMHFDEVVDKEHSGLILQGFKNLSNSTNNKSKFDSILIDSKRVCNFDSDTLSVNYHGFNFSRLTMPLTVGKFLKSVRDVECFFRFKDKFGVGLGNNIFALFPTLEDSYPKDYMTALELDDVEKPLDNYGYYEFDKKEFLDSVQIVFNTVGPSELILRFSQEDLVWSISSKSYKNIEAERQLVSEIGEKKETNFGLNAKKLINTLKSFKVNKIRFYDFSDFYVVLSNEDQKQLVFLLKNHI